MNLTDLKEVIKRKVLDIVDHRNLDLDVKYFLEGRIPSTTENLAIFIWTELQIDLGNLLFEVRIHETENNIVFYRG